MHTVTVSLECLSAAVLIAICSLVVGIPLEDFYPFGNGARDQEVFPNDDGSSLPIRLTVSFPFFDVDRDTVFVSAGDSK